MIKWERIGLIEYPKINNYWITSHAYVPTPIIIANSYIRVFVAFWDHNKEGRLGYIDLDINNPMNILGFSPFQIMESYSKHCNFYEFGDTPMSYVLKDGIIYLYYTGWGDYYRQHDYDKYSLFTGIAVSDNNGETFHRIKNWPILPPIKNQETIRTAAFVIEENSNYTMWYVGGNWKEIDGKKMPSYDLYKISSNSMFEWKQSKPILCMKAEIENGEYGIGRPFITKENGIYHMMYSSRRLHTGYKLMYSNSIDGINWENKQDVNIFPKLENNWDSEMQCFGYILKTPKDTLLFYNGNSHGRDGFGIAKLCN